MMPEIDMQDNSDQTSRVQFSETSELVLVTDLSEGPHKHNLWYTQNQFDNFKTDHVSYIRMVRLHISKRKAPTASGILGMEKFLTPQLTEEYKLRRTKLSTEVLKVARWQRVAARGIPSDELVDMLAKVAAENSRWARERARAAALFLEQDQEAQWKQNVQVLEQEPISHASATHRQWSRRASIQETKRTRMNPSPFESVPSITENVSPAGFVRTVTPPRCPC
eukprot:CAMPEP_0183724608 /NCGR_PEP_ID=MMETSP0737-20130205/18036_1 /TAXON_ID=385413 /ORGANISM="Thalassiosira miniscula, Strain CCMP1093" /LENGTH=222 /DNA_ID=CAMNT_0025955233 /DNA_START=134 /DNA_END=802 /DNA_ORIENTATION=+